MSDQLVLDLKPNMTEVERIHDAIDAFGHDHQWSPKSLYQVKLALEEAVVNILSYGFAGQPSQRILLTLSQQDQLLSVEICDNGLAFDPLQRAAPDLDSSLEDRAVGGLGVHLIRQMMDLVCYQRSDGWNRLQMSKSLH